jgi:hypothetical protein
MSNELEELFREHLLLIWELEQSLVRFNLLQRDLGANHKETLAAKLELLRIQDAYNEQSHKPVAKLREFLKYDLYGRNLHGIINQALGTAANSVVEAAQELIGACYKDSISRKKDRLIVYAKEKRPVVGAIRTNVSRFVTKLQKKYDHAGATLYERLIAVVKSVGSFYVSEQNLVVFNSNSSQFQENSIENRVDWKLDNDTTLARPEHLGSVIATEALEHIVKKLTSTAEFVRFAAPLGGPIVLDSAQELIRIICPELSQGIRFGDLIKVTKAPFRQCYVRFEGSEFITEREDGENDAIVPLDPSLPEFAVDFSDVLDCIDEKLSQLANKPDESGRRWRRIYSVWLAIRDKVQVGSSHGFLAEIARELDMNPRTVSDYWNEIKEIAADCLGEKN